MTHPHYTPDWLSERVADLIPDDFRGTIVDPACGGGTLLAAAAIRLAAQSNGLLGVRLVGFDIDAKAVATCEKALDGLTGSGMLEIQACDYLTLPAVDLSSAPHIVLMNPPFLGYGRLGVDQRDRLSNTLGMRGRFNLSHAFVIKAIRDYQPELLVSILPSNWYFSRASAFRAQLDSLGGAWSWRNVGDAFEGIAAHVGILVWRPNTGRQRRVKPFKSVSLQSLFDVRQGVATGHDEAFRALAKLRFPGGRRVEGVVGRDIQRGPGFPIWLLNCREEKKLASLESKLPHDVRIALEGRACFKTGRKGVLSYHEGYPEWFFGEPKLLLPEVVSGELRVELDRAGEKLPLHSTFAIRVPSAAKGRELMRFLQEDRDVRRLLGRCPRLSGGAIRINSATIRDCLSAWESKCGK